MKKPVFQTKRWALALCGGAALGCSLTAVSCQEYDLDEKLPPDFGETIYSYLRDNNYTVYARLAQDLGYEESLSGISIKTIFAADDATFDTFFKSNKWGVHSYDELSLAQKKMLFYSVMIDNSLQLMKLSSTSGTGGTVEGMCMRRTTASSVYDTVPIIHPDEMPDNNPYWSYYRENNKSIVCMKDNSTAPIQFFVEKFLTANRITNDDVDFLFNYKTHRESGDAGVNGVLVKEGNIRCANGFIHSMEAVMTPLDNMAEVIRTNPNTSVYSRLLERYSAPYYLGREVTNNYNYEYGTAVDSVFQKLYFSARSAQGRVDHDPNDAPVKATLKFDPGWNAFYSDNPNAQSTTVAMQGNMGVMLVPSNAALEEYWNNGVGKVLKDYYGDWDKVPDEVLVKLLNNNMLNSFVNSVPSKFASIVNSTQDPMGIKKEDVDSVFLACNGAIYMTNKVFSPTEYISVSFPALVNKSMNILNWAIEQYQYSPYLNSLDAYYSFFIPTNNGMLYYVDPVAYNQPKTQILQFHYDEQADDVTNRVWASIYEYDLEEGVIGDSIGETRGRYALESRLKDILDNHIIVGNIESGKTYYKSKNGGIVKVNGRGALGSTVEGTLQTQKGRTIQITEVYDQSKEGNGKSYILDSEPLLTTNNSVMDILEQHEEFSIFRDLMAGSELIEMQRNGAQAGSPNGNIATFNNYNYSVYVPTNASLQELIASGDLPTWEQIGALEGTDVPQETLDSLGLVINEFLRYHIQDNSVYIGMEMGLGTSVDVINRNYETAIMNDVTSKFYTLHIVADQTSIQLTDNLGHKRHVLTDDANLYNLSAREYQLNGGISTSAFAVVHRIDGPLFYKKEQCTHYNK